MSAAGLEAGGWISGPKTLQSGDASVSKALPALSIGLAVRNGGQLVERCIESILSQDFTDLELVICDNASDDGTIRKLEEYARADRRIRFSVNQVNIGSHENMRRVLDISRGTFFRWISDDDWLEPGCLSTCVRALESRPDAIGVTTWFTIHTPDGSTRYEEYRGEFPNSPDPARRFERMLWFFHAGDAKYDPIYGIYRRDRLMRTSFPRPSERTDWLTQRRTGALRSDHPCGQAAREPHSRLHPRASIELRSGVASIPPAQSRWRTSPRRLYREFYALAVIGGPFGSAVAPLQIGTSAFLAQGASARLVLAALGRASSHVRTLNGRGEPPRDSRAVGLSSTWRSHSSRQYGYI